MKRLGAACILFVLAAGGVRAAVVPACPAPAGVSAVAFGDLPAGVRKVLAEKTGEMALPGQPFNVTDVVSGDKPLPFSRGLFVWNRGTRWVIATEHGGIGYSDPIYAFGIAADGKGVKLIASKPAVPKTVCATAAALFEAR